MAHDPQDADRIIRQEHTGMFRSLDGGDHWGAITAYGTDTWQPEDTAADGGITQTVDTLARW